MVFIVPMFAIAGYAIGATALDLLGGRTEEAKWAAFLAMMCILSGGGLAVSLTRGYREEALRRQTAEANRNTPWAVRPDWATGVITAGSPSKARGSIFSALVVLAAVVPVVVGLWSPVDAGNAILIVPAAIGLGVLAVTIRSLVHHVKFGDSKLALETIPGVVGRSLRGTVHIGSNVDLRGDVRVRLRCVRSILHTGDTDGAASPHESTDTFWEEVQSASPRYGGDGAFRIPVAFALPNDLPSLSDNDALTWYRYELVVDGDARGIDFHAAFDVPVYRTAESTQRLTAPEKSVTAIEKPMTAIEQPLTAAEKPLVEAAPPEHYSRPYESRIRVSTRGGELTLEFPPARNALLALRDTAYAVTFCSLAVWLILKGAGAFVLFPGGFGAWAALRALDQWLRASRISVGEGSISVASGWLVPGRARKFDTASIDDLSLKLGEQIMGTPYYDIVLQVAGRRPNRVARGIRDKREAEWLMSRLVTALESTSSASISTK